MLSCFYYALLNLEFYFNSSVDKGPRCPFFSQSWSECWQNQSQSLYSFNSEHSGWGRWSRPQATWVCRASALPRGRPVQDSHHLRCAGWREGLPHPHSCQSHTMEAQWWNLFVKHFHLLTLWKVTWRWTEMTWSLFVPFYLEATLRLVEVRWKSPRRITGTVPPVGTFERSACSEEGGRKGHTDASLHYPLLKTMSA